MFPVTDSWVPLPEIVIELVWGATQASGVFESANAQPKRGEPLNWEVQLPVCDSCTYQPSTEVTRTCWDRIQQGTGGRWIFPEKPPRLVEGD